MSFTAFFLILASALSHASWNFLCKSRKPSPSFMLVLNISSLILLTPFFLLLHVNWSQLPTTFWSALAISTLANVVYSVALGLAYKFGDISITYPLSRSLPVLLTAIITITLHIGKTPNLCALIGYVVLFFGCISLPQKSFRSLALKNYITPAMIPIILAALGTTCYTISDSVASRELFNHSTSSRIINCGAYFFILQLGLSITQWFTLYFLSPRKNREEMRDAFRQPYPYLAGFFNFVAYFLVLLSMQFVTNVSYVQAFRQMGLPIGVFLGIHFLHEKISIIKLLGITLIILGLILTVL